MNAPVSIRDLMTRVVLTKQAMQECRDAEWTMAVAAHADAVEELHAHVATACQLDRDSVPDLGGML